MKIIDERDKQKQTRNKTNKQTNKQRRKKSGVETKSRVNG